MMHGQGRKLLNTSRKDSFTIGQADGLEAFMGPKEWRYGWEWDRLELPAFMMLPMEVLTY